MPESLNSVPSRSHSQATTTKQGKRPDGRLIIGSAENAVDQGGDPSPNSKNGEEDITWWLFLVRQAFGFHKSSLSLLIVITYFLVLILFKTQENRSLKPPAPEPKLLSKSWEDLQIIGEHFHPFNSHAIDDLHDYLTSRVYEIATSSKNDVEIDDDWGRQALLLQRDVFNESNTAGRVIYFESGNILAKVIGKNASLGAVLISAHYDSVTAGYGVTDDGAGIASMLGLLTYFASNPQERTIIFNYNFNEEFGLLGAELFFHHPWSKNVESFIDLEGTGAGGRAILFRTTDYGMASHYSAARSPFGTSLFQQGFAQGLVRSETDYKIYTRNGLRGLDIAFYRPRSLYHTKNDNIQGTSKGSLWHMLSNALDVTESLASTTEYIDTKQQAVYFDILGKWFIAFPVYKLFLTNLIGLISVPIILIILCMISTRIGTWESSISSILRGPITFIVSSGITILSSYILFKINPMVVVSDFVRPLIALSSIFLLSSYIILSSFNYLHPVHEQKLTILLQSFIFTWIITLFTTIAEKGSNNTSTGYYAVTIVYYLYSITTLLGCFTLLFSTKEDKKRKELEAYKNNSYGSTIDHDHENHIHEPLNLDSTDDITGSDTLFINEDAGSESSPLLGVNGSTKYCAKHDQSLTFKHKLRHATIKSLNYDWSLQFLILVPISTFYIYDIGYLLLEGIGQTPLETYSSQLLVFKMITLISILIGFPTLPFIHKFHIILPSILVISTMVLTFISLFESPFTRSSPLKLSFNQNINLNDENPLPIVKAYGRDGYIKPIIEDIPSIKYNNEEINCESSNDGKGVCSYKGISPSLISSNNVSEANDYFQWMNVKVINSSPKGNGLLKGEVLIEARENRACTVYFNTTVFYSSNSNTGVSPVKVVTVFHDDNNEDLGNWTRYKNINEYTSNNENEEELKQTQYPLSTQRAYGYSKDPMTGSDSYKYLKGINEFQVHKLNWTHNTYHVGFEWIPRWLDDSSDNGDDYNDDDEARRNALGVQVYCYWGDYDKESLVDGEIRRKVPAFDEVLHYSPYDVSWTVLGKGTVVINKYVEL